MRDIEEIKNDIPFYDNQGKNIKTIDLLVNSKIAVSKREAREFLLSKTISIDGIVVINENEEIIASNFNKKYLFIKKGKRTYFLIKY